MEGEIPGFQKIFNNFCGFDIIVDPEDVDNQSYHLAIVKAITQNMNLPCFGRYGFGSGWCIGARVDLPMCQQLCSYRSKCFNKFNEELELKPQVRSLIDSFLKGIHDCPACKIRTIGEEFKKLGFEGDPVWKAVSENIDSGCDEKEKLLKIIRFN